MGIMREIFSNISGCPQEEKIQEAYKNAMSSNHATQKKLEFELQKNRKQLEILRGEIAKSLTGDSIYTSEDGIAILAALAILYAYTHILAVDVGNFQMGVGDMGCV